MLWDDGCCRRFQYCSHVRDPVPLVRPRLRRKRGVLISDGDLQIFRHGAPEFGFQVIDQFVRYWTKVIWVVQGGWVRQGHVHKKEYCYAKEQHTIGVLALQSLSIWILASV